MKMSISLSKSAIEEKWMWELFLHPNSSKMFGYQEALELSVFGEFRGKRIQPLQFNGETAKNKTYRNLQILKTSRQVSILHTK